MLLPQGYKQQAGETATATVHTVDQEGRECQLPVEVSCELVSSDGASKTAVKVRKLERVSTTSATYHSLEDDTTSTFK